MLPLRNMFGVFVSLNKAMFNLRNPEFNMHGIDIAETITTHSHAI